MVALALSVAFVLGSAFQIASATPYVAPEPAPKAVSSVVQSADFGAAQLAEGISSARQNTPTPNPTDTPYGGVEGTHRDSPFKVIEDPETPMSTQQQIKNWSLLDLIMTVCCVVLMLTAIASGLITHVGEEHPKRMPLRLLSIVPAVAAVLLFFNTQDLSLPMSLIDDMTIWFAVLIVVSATLALVVSHRPRPRKLPEDDKLLRKT
jgi:hypothetical protein